MPRKKAPPDPSISGAPRYRLHKRSGQAVVTLAGRDFYLGGHASQQSRDAYTALVALYRRYGGQIPESALPERWRRPAARIAEAPLSVAELLAAYLDDRATYYLRPDGTPNEHELYHVRRALKPVRELFGLTPAADFDPLALGEVQRYFVQAGYCRTTCNKYTRRVRHAWKWAVATRRVPVTTWQALTAVENLRRGHTTAPESRPVRAVPAAFVDAIQPHVSREVWGLVELQRYSGARPGEAVTIRAADIDTRGAVWMYTPRHHKTAHLGKGRVIALGPRCQAVLRGFFTADTQAFLFKPSDAERKRRAVLTAARKTPRSCGNRVGSNRKDNPARVPGDHYTTGSYGRAVRTGCDAADGAARRAAGQPPCTVCEGRGRVPVNGKSRACKACGGSGFEGERLVPVWSPNQLRHSFATLARDKFGLDAAQVLLGHATADITQVYAETNQKRAAELAARIG